MKKYLIITSLLVVATPTNLWAKVPTDATLPTCEEMGYIHNSTQCAGLDVLRCPINNTKLYCSREAPVACKKNAKYKASERGCMQNGEGEPYVVTGKDGRCRIVSEMIDVSGGWPSSSFLLTKCKTMYNSIPNVTDVRLATAEEIIASISMGNATPGSDESYGAITNDTTTFVVGNGVVKKNLYSGSGDWKAYCHAEVPCITDAKLPETIGSKPLEQCEEGRFYEYHYNTCFATYDSVGSSDTGYIISRDWNDDRKITIIKGREIGTVDGGYCNYGKHYAMENCGGEEKTPTMEEYKELIENGGAPYFVAAYDGYLAASDGCLKVNNNNPTNITLNVTDYATYKYMCKTEVTLDY